MLINCFYLYLRIDNSSNMNTTNIWICALLSICVWAGSCRERPDLHLALQLAGDNKVELEKVLNHYKNDSLKYKAACFLIENMPGHYSYADDRINSYYSEVDTVLTSKTLSPDEKMKIVEQIAMKYPRLNTKVIEDLQIIKADFLICNIDRAFKDWKEQRMLRHVTFDQFCEFMLPYKVEELQQLDHWKDSLRGKYSTRYRTESVPSRFQFSVYNASNSINAEVSANFPQNHQMGNYYRFLSASTIDKMPFGQCEEYAVLATAVLRSEGIPVVREDLVQWGNKPAGHSWYSMLNSDGNILPFYWGLLVSPGASFYIDEPVPKVYRYTYARNERPFNYLNNCKKVPLYVSIFKKDITAEYIAVSNLSIPITNKDFQKEKWAYIAVFDNQKWALVDYGEIKNRKAHFENMGRNIVYLVMGYDGRRLIPVSDPFILHTDGEVESLAANLDHPRNVKLTRKYPMSDHTLQMERRLVGGKIEASETSDFSKKVTLHEIEAGEQGKFITLNNTGKYRYWRYLSPYDSYGNIAELELYEQSAEKPSKGKLIGNLTPYQKDEQWGPDKAFDGDWLTYFSCDMASYGWLGVDFQRPVNIEKFRCIPRSDDNGIRTGDEYELFYWGDHAWCSLGRKIGETEVLHFDSVPGNALFLLKNLSRGKEERIFTYSEDMQIWW